MTIQVNNVSDSGAMITLGDYIKCYADGNPAPSYEWTIIAELSNITIQNSDFVLNASMLCNFQFNAECKATNEFGESTTRFTRNATGSPIKS